MATSARGRLLSVIEAAKHLGLSEMQMRRVIRRAELPVMRTGTGRVMGVYEKDADAWQAERLGDVKPATTSVDDRIRTLMPTRRRFGS